MNEQELDDIAVELWRAEDELASAERAPNEGRVTDERLHMERLRKLRERVDQLRGEFDTGKALLESEEE